MKITVPKEGFQRVLAYNGAYFLRYDIEETENNVYDCEEYAAIVSQPTRENLTNAFVAIKYKPLTETAILADHAKGVDDRYEEYQAWRTYCQKAVTEFLGDETLEGAKKQKVQDLLDYDNSPAVNEFYINNNPMWLTKDERSALMLRVQVCYAKEIETTTLWYNGVQFTLPATTLESMLLTVEEYADKAFDTRERHRASINALESIESVKAYDYTEGFPEKIHFDINGTKS